MAAASLVELSEALASIVKAAAPSVVRVEGRTRSSSGVAWAPDGTVVTASHGFDWEDDLTLGLPTGEAERAEVVGRDPSTDVAVLRARTGGLPAPAWSDAAPEVGALVLAVTRPGRGPRASLGLLSRAADAWRTPSGGKVDRYLELDVALHPAFSGGLVLDAGGRAIGLATAGLARGTPLAIPAATLARVVKAILAHGSVRRGYLGVASLPVALPPALARASGQASALVLTAVEDESPAARAGLTVGDLLLALDGTGVGHPGDLLPLLEEERIGQVTRARVLRGGSALEVAITIGARGGGEGRLER